MVHQHKSSSRPHPWLRDCYSDSYPWFSVMISYYEFMFMKSDSWIQIWLHEFIYLNSSIHEFINKFRIYTYEFIYSWIIYSWIHMIISCMNSYRLWIHICKFILDSNLNSYRPWIYLIILHKNSYHIINEFIYEFKVPKFQMTDMHMDSEWRRPGQCNAGDAVI